MRSFSSRDFELLEVEQGLWQLVEKSIRARIRSNIWIIQGQDADLVIDAGWGLVDWPMDALFPQADKPLWLALTHSHCDHMSQAFQFGSRRFGHPLAQPILTKPTAENTNAQPWTPRLEILDPGFDHLNFDALAYGHSFKPAPLTDTLTEGAAIDLGGRVLQVYETPGHSPDSLTFREPSEGWIFPGDVVMDGYIVDVLPDSDKREVLRSHERIRQLDFQKAFCGHGRILDKASVETIVEKYQTRKTEEGLSL